MKKQRFGDLVHTARIRKGLSLRELADRVRMDYSRLARIEHGTRPAPDLATMRILADELELDLAVLLISAGTAREVVEGLVWSERLALGTSDPMVAAYRPETIRSTNANRYLVKVREASEGRCRVLLGSDPLTVFTFSRAMQLQIELPPEAVVVFPDDPKPSLCSEQNVVRTVVRKLRRLGQVVDLVLGGDGYEINALDGCIRVEEMGIAEGQAVFTFLPPAAIRTFPVSEKEGA